MLLIAYTVPKTTQRRLTHFSSDVSKKCTFCKKACKYNPRDDCAEAHEIFKYFTFRFFCCHECNTKKQTVLNSILEVVQRHLNTNTYINVRIHFSGNPIVNPSHVYVPCINSCTNELQFLCMNRKSLFFCNTGDGCKPNEIVFLHTICGCVFDPYSGEIKQETVSIAQIIHGLYLLESERIAHKPEICLFHEFADEYPNFKIRDAFQQSAPESYVGPRIPDFSFTNPDSIIQLFSLLVSNIYPFSEIKAWLNQNHEMKCGIIKFITDSMISITQFMKTNGFDQFLPTLKEPHTVPQFLVKNYGTSESVFNYINVICVNFRNFLKLFKKILRYMYRCEEPVEPQVSWIDLFQYCRFLYATLHVRNIIINQRFARLVSPEKMHLYFRYLDKQYSIVASPFCKKIFATIPDSKITLDMCIICHDEGKSSVIGRCKKHNICCLTCFPAVVKHLHECSMCHETYFLP